MRSLVSFGTGKKTVEAGQLSGRPEALRRQTLAASARLIIIASLLSSPFALNGLLHGMLLPFILATLGIATGVTTLALCLRGRFERAAAGQVYGTLLAGMLLAIADPAIADFGLAVAVLAPIHASLLARSPLKKRAWVLLVGVVAFAAVGSTGITLWPEHDRPEFGIAGAVAFCVMAAVVAYTANRLNTVFEVYEKAQINAYRHLIEHVQDAVMRFSSEGDLLFSSRSSETLFGCRRFELSGGGLVERIHVLDRPAYMTAFADANRDGRVRTIEVRMRRDDPTAPATAPRFFWIEIALSPVLDPEAGDARHEVVALFRDVTDRRDQDNEMRRAREAAEEASEAKSRFLATIGHELRTPLNAIVGFSEMMTSNIGGDLAPAHREYAQLIHQSGQHLIGVVKMLLDMSRIEAGKFELQAEAFSPEALIEPCLQMVDALAREKNVTIQTQLSRALPSIVADERACRQMLLNLLSNAIKFSHAGGVVTIAMKRQGTSLNISVADRGIGMSPEAIDRIGEPFFQAHDGLARRYEGTGLGLSIVKGLVDLHEGSLHAISEAGAGTTITVLLPINGPAIKLSDTPTVTPLHREAAPEQNAAWPEQKRSAK